MTQESRYIKPFLKIIEPVAYHRGRVSAVFSDFLDLALYSLSRDFKTGESFFEEEYMQLIKTYSKEDAQIFPQLLAILVDALENHFDLLGTFHTMHCHPNKNLGQFFTPAPVARFMAEVILGDAKNGQSVLDPTCGAGALLLQVRWMEKANFIYCGIDLDAICAKMCALNLFLTGCTGEVICGNALTDNFFFAWQFNIDRIGRLVYVKNEDDALLWSKRPKQEEQKMPQQLSIF